MTDVLRPISVSKLELKPGDVLAVQVDSKTDPALYLGFAKYMADRIGIDGLKVLIVPGKLAIIRSVV